MSDVDALVNAMAGLTVALEQNRHGAYAAPEPAAPVGPDPFAQAAAQVLKQNPGASLEDVMSALGGTAGAPAPEAPAPSVAPDVAAELRAEIAQLREATRAMHTDVLNIAQAVVALTQALHQRGAEEPQEPLHHDDERARSDPLAEPPPQPVA